MAIAHFRPQAWIRDYAVEVDAEGATRWEVSPAYLKELVELHGFEKLCEASYEADDLRDDPAAPKWIREWHGPFDVSLEPESPSFTNEQPQRWTAAHRGEFEE